MPRPAPATRLALLTACLALGAGCATTERFGDVERPVYGAVDAFEPSVEDVRSLPTFRADTGARYSWRDVEAAVAWADVIVIGEQHDDGVGHAYQAEVVEYVCANWPGSAVSMEMLERDEQRLADDYRDGIIDAKALETLSNSSGWGGDGKWADWYQPIIDAAIDHDGFVVAANAPRRYVRLARRQGYDAIRRLPADRRQFVVLPKGDAEEGYRARFFDIMTMTSDDDEADEEDAGEEEEAVEETVEVEEAAAPTTQPEDADEDADAGEDEHADMDADDVAEVVEDEDDDEEEAAAPPIHFSMTPQMIENMFRSQRVWDATMGASAAQAWRRGAPKVVHVVGQFHSDFNGGTVQEIRRNAPGARILVISMRRAWPTAMLDEDRGRADLVVYTGERPEPEEEPEDEAADEPTEDVGETVGEESEEG